MPAECSVGAKPCVPFSCLTHLLEDQAKRIPDAPAILAVGRAPLTYAGLYQHINKTGRTLRAMGIGPDQLDFQQVAHPETIETALSRWAQLDDSDHEGKPLEGYFTSLSLKDEFRRLIAALYGRTWSNSKFAVQGSPSSADVAMRCAYYGNAQLSAKEMKMGFERDGDVYVFATIYDGNLFSNSKLRKLFEEEQLVGSNLSARYLKNFELKRKQWPYLESFLSNDVREEVATTKEVTKVGLRRNSAHPKAVLNQRMCFNRRQGSL